MSQALAQSSVLEQIAGSYSSEIAPAEYAVLNSEQRNLLSRLNDFEAPYLQEKLLSEGKFDNSQEYKEAFTEFKKYAALSQMVDGPLGMSSPKVDEVWHQFILFTPQYHEFCDRVLGEFLHHSPHTSQTPSYKKREGSLNFSRAYQQVFGEVPGIWKNRKNSLYNLDSIENLACDGCDTSEESGGCITGCDRS